MHRVERTNRLDRKRSTDASEHRVCDTDEVAATLKTTERARTAACSSSAVSRAAARARRMARAVSAIVNADVTFRPRARTDFKASESCSSSAATSALDSMYRAPVVSAVECGALALRFATIGVNQLGGSSRRKPDVRPRHCQVDENHVDHPPRYWALARRGPTMLGIKNGIVPRPVDLLT